MKRPEVQALRAIAVLGVVLFHLWSANVPGGYVGVDVFFGISGFLIIGQLFRESERTGHVRLAQFWARRARRLLPASLFVLLVTAVAIYLWVPMSLWQQWFSEVGASTVYLENWLLAGNSVDYLAASNAASPTQHYWSLSVEEQFYVVWPLIFVIALVMTRKAGVLARRRTIVVLLAAATLASFIYSIGEVAGNPAPAYFVTTTRAWEFGIGGLLAYLGVASNSISAQLRTVASWLGLLAIGSSVAFYNSGTPFPGATALLPVIGTLVVIWAGMPPVRWSPGWIMGLRPVQWLGDISYSLYLWHWPLIIILPFALGRSLGLLDRFAILAASILLAWLTKAFIEDRIRTGPALASRPAWLTFAATIAASGLIVAMCGAALNVASTSSAQAAARAHRAVASKDTCIGLPAAAPGSRCARPYAVTNLTDPTFAKNDLGIGVEDGAGSCKQDASSAALLTCHIGDTSNPLHTYALIGDSHAGQFLPALDGYGSQNRTEFVTYIKSDCAGTGARNVATPMAKTAANVRSCAAWGKAAIRAISADRHIGAVVFADYTQRYYVPGGASYGRSIRPTDYSRAWNTILAAGKLVIAIRDTPHANSPAPDCIAEHPNEYDPCSTPRHDALQPDAQNPVLIAAAGDSRVHVIDLTEDFCGAITCHSLIGGLIVYSDDHHITATFSATMSQILGEKISAADH